MMASKVGEPGATSNGDAMCIGAWAADDDGSWADGGAFGLPRSTIIPSASFLAGLAAKSDSSEEFVTFGGKKNKVYDEKTKLWVEKS